MRLRRALYWTDRAINYVQAKSGGWFWLRCERCGDWFGGHEEHGNGLYNIRVGPNWGHVVCKRHKPPPYCYPIVQRDKEQTILCDVYGNVVETIPWKGPVEYARD